MEPLILVRFDLFGSLMNLHSHTYASDELIQQEMGFVATK